jgi:hypothetical protein
MIAFGASPMRAQDSQGSYSHMAPLEQYLMDRNAEIALARSAAPEAVSRNAKVLVLGPHGFETAVEGTNGFVCMVGRAWDGPFDNPEFWNPRIRAAQCHNAVAARTIVPIYLKRAEMATAGMSKEQMINAQKAAVAKNELPALELGAMAYMMSKDTYLTDQGSHNLPHVMFYAPTTDGASWGADLPNSPVLLVPQDTTVPVATFLVVVAKWSDGTPAIGKHN